MKNIFTIILTMKNIIIILFIASNLLGQKRITHHEPYVNDEGHIAIFDQGNEYIVDSLNYDELFRVTVPRNYIDHILILQQQRDDLDNEIDELQSNIKVSTDTRDLINRIGFSEWSKGGGANSLSINIEEHDLSLKIEGHYISVQDACNCEKVTLSDVRSRYTYAEASKALNYLKYPVPLKGADREEAIYDILNAWYNNGKEVPKWVLDSIDDDDD